MVIMNTSSIGHNNDCFAVPTPTGGYMGRTSNMQDISDIMNLVKKSNGVPHVTCEIEPEINDMHGFRRTERVTEKITAANGRVRPGRSAHSGLVPDGRISLVSEHRGKHCEICTSKVHSLARCVFAPKGHIDGCPLCNSRSHQVDDCGEYKKLSMEDKVKILISDRASLPPLLTDEPWHDLLWHYLQREDAVVPEGYPWSEEFASEESCKDKCNASTQLQAAYDEAGDKGKLPVDVSTETLRAIRSTYWEHDNNRPWTDRLAALALVEEEKFLFLTGGEGVSNVVREVSPMDTAQDPSLLSRLPSPRGETTLLSKLQNAAANADKGKNNEIDYE
jgi:hypothetical protein